MLFFYLGKKFIAETFAPLKSAEESPLNYVGTYLINGKKQPTIRGPSYDIFYLLSNYYKFDVDFKFLPTLAFKKSLLEHKSDFIPIYQTGWVMTKGAFDDFAIGRCVLCILK